MPQTEAVAKATLEALAKGPTAAEKRDLGLSSEVSGTFTAAIAEGVAHLEGISPEPSDEAAQLVYTLTQFPTVKAVEIAGRRYTQADFEDETPAILVESPLPFEEVTSPFRVTGTANTFEATFEYELVDPDGKIIATHFATATSGSGTRGTFDFTVPYTTDRAGFGKLVVYERSAKDGSRIHLVEIPIHMTR